MPGFKDLLEGGRPLTPLDEETVALLSDPAMLARVEELEEALHAFKRQLGQEFLGGLRHALQARIEGARLSWAHVEEVRVETIVGLRPVGALAHDERAFWPVMNFATSPGIPFSAPWIGIATTPRSSGQLKQRIFDLTGGYFQNPKQAAPAAWWVQWDWCPSGRNGTGRTRPGRATSSISSAGTGQAGGAGRGLAPRARARHRGGAAARRRRPLVGSGAIPPHLESLPAARRPAGRPARPRGRGPFGPLPRAK